MGLGANQNWMSENPTVRALLSSFEAASVTAPFLAIVRRLLMDSVISQCTEEKYRARCFLGIASKR